MSQYKLKAGIQDFTVIDGPMSGKSFKRGIVYEEIPPQEAGKFNVIPDAPAASEAPAAEAQQAKGKKDKI
jgi:hypothetical protein